MLLITPTRITYDYRRVVITLPNNNELQSLLAMMAQRLGASPEDLKKGAQSGDLSKVLGKINPNDAAKIQQILNDKDAANKLLSSPQAQQLIQRLNGQK